MELLGVPPLGFFLTLALGVSAGLVAYLNLFTPATGHPALLFFPLAAGSSLIHYSVRSPQPLLRGTIHAGIMAGLFSLYALRFSDPSILYETAVFQISALILFFAPLPLSSVGQLNELAPLTSMSRFHGLIKQISIGAILSFLAFCLIAIFEPVLQLLGLGLLENLWTNRFPFFFVLGISFGLGFLAAPYLREVNDVADGVIRVLRLTAPVLAVFLMILSLAMMSSGALVPGQADSLFDRTANVNLIATILVFLGFACLLGLAVEEVGGLKNRDKIAAAGLILALFLTCLVTLAWSFMEVQVKGLTPMRGFSIGLRVLFLIASLFFAAPLFKRTPLQASLARANQIFLTLLVAWAVLTLSPLTHLQGWAADHQIAKLEAGESTELRPRDLDRIADTWGHAGERIRDAYEAAL